MREARIELQHDGETISGRIDFLLYIPSLIDALIELKTTNSRAMHMMVAKREYGRDSHIHQLNLYLEASQRNLLPDGFNGIAQGLLIYVVKDAVKGEPSAVGWDVPYTNAMAIDDLAQLAAIQKHVREQGLPPRPFANDSSWQCHYCPFRTTCWGPRG